MGFFRKKREISAEEQARRNGTVKPAPLPGAGKPFREMTETEKLDYWGSVYRMEDVRERLPKMEAIAEAGYETAYYCAAEDYLELGQMTGSINWQKLHYYLDKSVAARNPNACLLKARVCLRQDNPDLNADEGIRHYVMAVELGHELAVQEIRKYCDSEQYGTENKEWFDEALRPAAERMLSENTRISNRALGYLYYYGVYFAQDTNAAKEYFSRGAAQGDYYCQTMLNNPIFASLDEDDEE